MEAQLFFGISVVLAASHLGTQYSSRLQAFPWLPHSLDIPSASLDILSASPDIPSAIGRLLQQEPSLPACAQAI
jgi:hypothetical protein